MSNATISSIGQVNSAGDANATFLKLFSGEVLIQFGKRKPNVGYDYC